MPKKPVRKKQVNNKASSGNSIAFSAKASGKKWWVVGLIVGLVLVAAGVSFWMLKGGVMSEEAKMGVYLSDKYGREFAVTNIRTEGAGLGVRGEIVGDATPKNDKTLTFEVSSQTNGYHDQYAAAIWQRDENEKLATIIPSENSHLLLSAEIHILPSVDGNIKNTIPPLDKVPESYKQGITYYIHIRDKRPYDSAKDGQYMETLKAFSRYMLTKKTAGAVSVGYIIPDKAGYHYGASIEGSRLGAFLDDDAATFANYFKYIRSE